MTGSVAAAGYVPLLCRAQAATSLTSVSTSRSEAGWKMWRPSTAAFSIEMGGNYDGEVTVVTVQEAELARRRRTWRRSCSSRPTSSFGQAALSYCVTHIE